MIRLSQYGTALILASGLSAGAYGCSSTVSVTEPTTSADAGKKPPAKDSGSATDANVSDSSVDSGVVDSGTVDSGVVDSGTVDSGVVDSGTVDSGTVDSGTVDSGVADSGVVDSGKVDSGVVDSGTVDSGVVDSGSGDAGTFDSGVVDSGTGDAGTTSCYDSTYAISLPAQTLPPKAAQGVCTTKQVDDFYTACFDANSTTTGCDAFVASNTSCSDCLSLTTLAKPLSASYPIDDYYVSANVLSCGYLQIGKPECALPAVNQDMCTNSSCTYCGDQASYDACLVEAQSTGCQSFTVPKTCTDAYTAAQAKIDAACLGVDFKSTYTKVANYMCGK